MSVLEVSIRHTDGIDPTLAFKMVVTSRLCALSFMSFVVLKSAAADTTSSHGSARMMDTIFDGTDAEVAQLFDKEIPVNVRETPERTGRDSAELESPAGDAGIVEERVAFADANEGEAPGAAEASLVQGDVPLFGDEQEDAQEEQDGATVEPSSRVGHAVVDELDALDDEDAHNREEFNVSEQESRYHVCELFCQRTGSPWASVEDLCNMLPAENCEPVPAALFQKLELEPGVDHAFVCESTVETLNGDVERREVFVRMQFDKVLEKTELASSVGAVSEVAAGEAVNGDILEGADGEQETPETRGEPMQKKVTHTARVVDAWDLRLTGGEVELDEQRFQTFCKKHCKSLIL